MENDIPPMHPLRSGSTIADYQCVFDQVFIPYWNGLGRMYDYLCGSGCALIRPEKRRLLYPGDFGTLTQRVRDATEHPLALVLERVDGPSHSDAIAVIVSALNGTSNLPEPGGELHRTTLEIVAALNNLTTCSGCRHRKNF